MGVQLDWSHTLGLAATAEGYPAPVPEYRFHETRRWRFDLAWPALKVAFEREGMARPGGKSRHTTFSGYSADCEKYNAAQIGGWLVIRATVAQIRSGDAARWVLEALAARTEGGA